MTKKKELPTESTESVDVVEHAKGFALLSTVTVESLKAFGGMKVKERKAAEAADKKKVPVVVTLAAMGIQPDDLLVRKDKEGAKIKGEFLPIYWEIAFAIVCGYTVEKFCLYVYGQKNANGVNDIVDTVDGFKAALAGAQKAAKDAGLNKVRSAVGSDLFRDVGNIRRDLGTRIEAEAEAAKKAEAEAKGETVPKEPNDTYAKTAKKFAELNVRLVGEKDNAPGTRGAEFKELLAAFVKVSKAYDKLADSIRETEAAESSEAA